MYKISYSVCIKLVILYILYLNNILEISFNYQLKEYLLIIGLTLI